jgi:hypothetical protein
VASRSRGGSGDVARLTPIEVHRTTRPPFRNGNSYANNRVHAVRRLGNAAAVATRQRPQPEWTAVPDETMRHYHALLRLDTSNSPGNERRFVDYLADVMSRPASVRALSPSSRRWLLSRMASWCSERQADTRLHIMAAAAGSGGRSHAVRVTSQLRKSSPQRACAVMGIVGSPGVTGWLGRNRCRNRMCAVAANSR